MKERPILFNGAMVQAILSGAKTQTRRQIKGVPYGDHCGRPLIDWGLSGIYQLDADKIQGLDPAEDGKFYMDVQTDVDDNSHEEIFCQHGTIGDRLWVREAFYQYGHWEPVSGVKTKKGKQKRKFVADKPEFVFEAPESFRKGRHSKDPATQAWHKRLGRFMPRRASRITLEITNVRVERVQDISEEDILAEGVTVDVVSKMTGVPWSEMPTLHNAWGRLWNSINGNWDKNPLVWVLTFKRI